MFVGVFVGVNVGVKNDKKWAFPGFKVPEPIEGRRVGLYSLRSRSLASASLRPYGLLSLTQLFLFGILQIFYFPVFINL